MNVPNRDIMTDLGMRYAVFREGESGPERVRVQGTSIIPVKGAIRSMNLMIHEHQEEVGKLVEIFMTTDQGFAETIQAFVNNDADDFTALYELWYEQYLFDDVVRVKIGKLDANSEFAYVEHGGEFIHSSPGVSPSILSFPRCA